MQEASVESLAKRALLEPNFPQFFHLLVQISDNYTQYQLGLEAVKVAALHKNVGVLRQLAHISVGSFETAQLLESVLEAIINLQAIDVAISVVVLGNKQLEAGLRWYILAKVLLNNHDYEHVKEIFIYIQDKYHRYDIAKTVLDKLKPEERLFDWLEWFDHFTQTGHHLHADIIKRLISALSQYNDFSIVCQHLKAMNGLTVKQEITYKLYLKFVVSGEVSKIQSLEQILVEGQRWLVQVRQLLNGENHFDVIDRLEYTDATTIIPLVVRRLVHTQLEVDDDILAKSICCAAESSQQHTHLIIAEGCNACFHNNRLDVVIILLANLDKYALLKQLLALTTRELRMPQYQALLPYIPSLTVSPMYYESDEVKILKKVPTELIEAERKRRAQDVVKKAEADFAKLGKVSSKHPQFKAIHQTIVTLFEYNELEMSLTLCRKLVPSTSRDVVLRKLFHCAIIQGKFMAASKGCKLLMNHQEHQFLQTFSQQYAQKKYRHAYKTLVKPNQVPAQLFTQDKVKAKSTEQSVTQDKVQESLTAPTPVTKMMFRSEYSQLMSDCIEKILATEGEESATQFFEANGVFDLPESPYDIYDASTLKNKVIESMIARCKDDRGRIRLIRRLSTYQQTSVMVYVLQIFINPPIMSCVIEVLNLVAKVEDNKDTLPKKIKEVLTEFLRDQPATVELLKHLLYINIAAVRQNLVRTCLNHFSLEIAKATLPVIATFPDAELKKSYLLEALVLAIIQREFDFASQVVMHLVESERMIWTRIIHYAKEKKYVDLLNVLLDEVINIDKLLNWTIERWLEDVTSPSYLLQNLRSFLQHLQSLQNEQPHDGQFTTWIPYLAKQNLNTTLTRRAFQAWSLLLQKKALYSELIDGCASLLPEAVRANFNDECVKPLRDVVNTSIAFSASMLLTVGRLLYKYEISFPDHLLSVIIEKMLEQGDLVAACRLMSLIDAKESDWLERNTLKIATGYFQCGDYPAVVKLIKPYSFSYTVRPIVLAWIIDLVGNNKVEQAIVLIQQVLSTSRENEMMQVIDAFIEKRHLIAAARYLSNIHTPATKLRLQQSMRSAYVAQLGVWIEEVHASKLNQLHQQISEYMQLITIPQQKEKANHLKNEIIVETRSLLDRAFLAFYSKKYGDPPSRVNVYFPVVPKLQRASLKDDLQYYFSVMLKNPRFSKDFRELFDYLLQIQPLHNQKYSWLGHLYSFANIQKHANDLPAQPIIDAAVINMMEFLPQLLNGGTELLLKLFQWRSDINVINDLRFTSFVPLQPLAVSTYNPMIFRPPSPPKPGEVSVVAAEKGFRKK